MNYHCRNYLCQLLSGCVCDCDYCYQAKSTPVETVCPECGYCRHCGRKNEIIPNQWIWVQPSYIPPVMPSTPYWPQGPTWTLPYTGDVLGYTPTITCGGF
ncbi:MAG TPA: hypothetical protein VNX68_15560 [Nitrosopumilaceae archaeon]|jgi:hypothetical protein|nr:hypothetical protein [Nitrosopumilaceae archaeon]